MPYSTKLTFIQILPTANIMGDFILKDLPGSGKRIDVVCRVFAACFDWGPVTMKKSNIEVIAVIANNVILKVQYPKENIPSGEKAWAKIIKESLNGNPPDFVHFSEGNLESVITAYSNANLWVLHEDGEERDLQDIASSTTDNSFMLGDHRGFDSQTEDLITKYALRKVSLGTISYLSSHCVAHIISEFERKDE
jgi:tRNA (pseudouridine54-N1)-methyltransferase